MGDDDIFRDQGRPVKFFIQKDLPENIIIDLTEQITANGGSVEDKVPLQGFVVVDPTSGEGKRLYACWNAADRPLRCFVPPTFVPACLQARRVLPQPFRDRARAVRKRMHIHPSIANERIVEVIHAQIWNSGGDPTATELEADVIIAEEDNPVFRELVMRYDHTRHKFVESTAWVKKCVELGKYENTPSVKKNMGGRIKGSRRTEFSEMDDTNLAKYIATRLPDPTMRGRTGNKMYQDLCSRVDLYPWAERHPWQSWRERYKNNTQRFAHLIDSFAKQNPVSPDGKGLHGFVRVSSSLPGKSSPSDQKPTFDVKKDQVNSPTTLDAEWEGSQWDVKIGRKSPPAWGKGKRKAEELQEGPVKRSRIRVEIEKQPTHIPNVAPEEMISQMSSAPLHPAESQEVIGLEYPALATDADGERSITRSQSPEGNVKAVEAASSSPTLSDSDDEGVGDETQLLLTANREMLANASDSRSSNIEPATQDLTNFVVPQTHNLKATTVYPTVNDIVPKALDADQVLVQIACQYRFLLDEVKEVYEEQQRDLDRTTAFFKEARQDLMKNRAIWEKIGQRITQEPELE